MLFWMIFVQSASLPVLATGIFRNMCCQLSRLTGAMREAEGHNAAHQVRFFFRFKLTRRVC
jgi:hypothetical protein